MYYQDLLRLTMLWINKILKMLLTPMIGLLGLSCVSRMNKG